jgi:amino acid adenylation domain-containing protein
VKTETNRHSSDQTLATAPQFVFPTTFAQQRLWFLEQLQPEQTAYLIPWSLRIEGDLNSGALERSLSEIIHRHEILRTTFSWKDERPVQVVGQRSFSLPLVDLSGKSHPEEEAEQLARAEARMPLDLERGPLVRGQLLRVSPSLHILLLTMHHIIFDGWSRRIFIQELSALYDAFRAGLPSPLPAPKLQYADYAVWQRRQLQGAKLEKQLSYWREQLAGMPPALELPTDRPRPAVQTFHGAKLPLEFSKEFTEKLNTFSRRQNVTPFMTLLAGFQCLLSRHSGQNDVAVGTPIANRNRAELEEIVGLFANTLVFRSQISSEQTFHDLLAQVQKTSLDAYANQDVPFEKLVEELSPERNLAQNPLFQVLFSLQNAPQRAFKLGDLKVGLIDLGDASAKFDLSIFLREAPDGIRGRVEYNTDLFDTGTIQRLLEHYRVLLTAAVANPALRVSELPLLTEGERKQIVEKWNATRAGYAREACLYEAIEQQAARVPEGVACVQPGETAEQDRYISYGELNARANQLARALRRRGAGPGVRIGVFVERSLEMMVALLGIQKSGAAYVPLDPGYPAERIRLILEDAQPKVLVTQSSLTSVLPESTGGVLLLDCEWKQIAEESTGNVEKRATADDLAYVIFTSGSTGRPKGVEIRHGAVVNLLTFMARELHMGSDDVVPALASFAFDMCIPELYLALTTGGRVVIGNKDLAANGEELAGLLRRTGATVVHATPTTWRLLLEAGFTGKGLKRVIGAEPLPRELCRRLLEADPSLYNFYGPTETTVWSTWHQFRSAEEPVVVGRPIANTQVYILDERRQPVPIGVAGELYIGGDGLARGYLKREELTAEKFVPHPFSQDPNAKLYRTGDLARYLADGNVQYLGRSDYQVKVRGYRIELGEIESAISKHSSVQECVVTAREDVEGDKRLVAYVIPAADHAVDVAELRVWLKQRLPEYMVPAAVVELKAFPLTPNGKVDRKALPAPEYTRPELESEYQAARTPAEEMLSTIWAEVMKLTNVGVHDNFFELGGHSLLATQVVARIREVFEVELPLRALFEAPTIAGLAEKVTALESSAHGLTAPPLKPVPRNQPLPLSFAQQRLWFLDKLEPNNPLYNIPQLMRMKGALKAAALELAVNRVIARHESLRTSFPTVDGSPVQHIAASLTLTLNKTDLRLLPDTVRESEARRLALVEIGQPFDLQTGPLIRTMLLELTEQDHIFVLNTHHIISDRWSMNRLWQEIVEGYEHEVNGVALDQPALAIQYADYALWQREYLSGEMLDQQLSYWKETLAGAPASLDLPTNRPRPAQQSFRGSRQTVVLPKTLGEELQALSRREGATLFMTLLAAFNVLLMRYSGQEDIVIGSPIAGRTRPELEKLIGFFVNTLVLRTRLDQNPSFRELLRQVRETAMGAYAHQDVPFEKLVEELKPERDLSRNPLFQVMFALQNVPAATGRMAGVEVSGFQLAGESAKFDLTLFAVESPEGLRATFEYNTDLFDASTIERLMRHFEVLLTAAVANPELRVQDLPLLDEAERQQILDWNATRAEYPREQSLAELFEQQAARTPEATAVLVGKRSFSYRQLNERANQIAHYLRAKGAGPEQLVGLYLERDKQLLPAILGVLKTGAAYVPMDPQYPRERVQAIVKDARAGLVVTEQSLRAQLELEAEVIALDGEKEAEAIGRQSRENPALKISRNHLAYVLFTSGSTGRPKGVAIEQASALTFVAWARKVFSAEELAGVLFSTSVCFDLSVFEMFVPLSVGGKIIVVENALYLPRAEARGEVTLINTVPSAMAELVRGRAVPRSVKTINLAGEALSTALVEEIYAATHVKKVYNLYGPTEDTTYSTYTLTRRGATVTIGRPLPGTQAYVLDPNRQVQPVGVPGELYLGGAGLARGYYGRLDLTAERFVPNPFAGDPTARMYRTGDLCRWRADGELEYLGRLDSQVKLRGFRIELGEIESTLAKHPAVRQAIVAAREDRPGDKRLIAYVILQAGQTLTLSDMRAHIKQSLPDYMVPSTLVPLDSVPLTPNGKVDRKRLPAPDNLSARAVPPRDLLEESIAQIWREILGIPTVGITDNFFDLGGQSIMSVRLMSEVRNRTGIELPLTALFQNATIEHLAELVRGNKILSRVVVHQIQAGNGRPPLFAAVLAGVNALGYVPLAKHLGPQQPLYALQSPGPGPRATGRPYTAKEYEAAANEYIHAMRTVQPKGPYYICGTCEGARIAFEMARILEAQGESINLLGVIDTWVLENTQNRRLWRIYYYSARLQRLWKQPWHARWNAVSKALRNRILWWARSEAAPPKSEWMETYWPGENFVVPHVHSRITIFKIPRQPFYYRSDPLLGWGDRTKSGVDLYMIPNGRHLLLLREPYVQELAAAMSECLKRCQAMHNAIQQGQEKTLEGFEPIASLFT